MICPNCHCEIGDSARFCMKCGNPVAAQKAPAQANAAVAPVQTAAVVAPVQPSAPAAPPAAVPEQLPDESGEWFTCPKCGNLLPGEARICGVCGGAPVVFSPPAGFMLDQRSGLYYKSMPGNDRATGAPGQLVTWFSPVSGEYRQQFHLY